MRKFLLLLALLALAAVGTYLLTGGDFGFGSESREDSAAFDPPSGSERPGEARLGEGAAGADGRSLLADAPRDVLEGRTRPNATAVDRLQGVVQTRRGLAIEGASVLTLEDGILGTTDAEGRFDLPLQGPFDRLNGRTVFAWAPDRTLERKYFREPGRIVVELGEDRGREIRIVRARDDAPISGARAQLRLRAQSGNDRDGFEQPNWVDLPVEIAPSTSDGAMRVPVGYFCTLLIQADGYEQTHCHLDASISSPSRRFVQTVRMYETRDLRVRFVQSEGYPIADALVDFAVGGGENRTDENGWVRVPELARKQAWAIYLVRDGLRWVQFVDDFGGPVRNGTEFRVEHRARSGKLETSGRGRADDYEIATTGMIEGIGLTLMPDPERRPQNLLWQTVPADGGFELTSGWQSQETALVVRAKETGELVHSMPLRGAGPYEVKLEPRARARLHFTADPEHVLLGATAILQPMSMFAEGQFLARIERPIRDGVIEVELQALEYEVVVALKNQEAAPLPAGRFRMPASDFETSFDLGSLRRVIGRVLAGGKPVHPCRVQVTDDGKFRLALHTDEQGWFTMMGAPAGVLGIYVQPADPWLAESRRKLRRLMPGQTEIQVEIPVAELNLSADPAAFDPSLVSVTRWVLPSEGVGPIRPDFGSPLRLPDLREEPVSLRLSPSRVQFTLFDSNLKLVPNEITLHEGETQTVHLRTAEVGLLKVRYRGAPGQYLARIQVHPAGTIEDPNFTPQPYLGQRGPTDIAAYALDAGPWKVAIQGPLSRYHPSEPQEVLLPAAGTWEGEVALETGRTTVLEIWVQEEQLLTEVRYEDE